MQRYFDKFFSIFTKSLMVISIGVLAFSASVNATASKAPTKMLPAPAAPFESLSPYATDRSNKIALQFIERTGITKNLSLLVLQDVKNRRQIRDAITLYGMPKVQAAVVDAIKAAQKIYAPQWNQLIAEIYVEHFTATELASIMARREASPFFPRLLDLQGTIAEAVHARGDQMVASARIDVMSHVANALPTPSRASLGR